MERPDNLPPVLGAIWTLLEARQRPTVAAIKRYAKVDERRVIDTLARNRNLLGWDKRNRIYSLAPLVSRVSDWRQRAIDEGRAFVVREINYGAARELHFGGPLHASMKRSYWEGGLGDCCEIFVVLATPENERAVRAAGLVPAGELVPPPLTDWWVEEAA